MNTVKFNKGSTRIIAHRGLSGLETENTASAFVAAGNRSYYGMETDIHRTADGDFILCHDDNLGRIAGEDISAEKSTKNVLKEIVLFDKDGTKDREDIRLCTLQGYLSIAKKYEKHAVLELKSDFCEEEILNIIEIIKSYDYLDSLTFISFNYENLLKVRKHLPKQSAQYLIWKITEEELERLKKDRIDVDVWCKELTKEQIDLAHSYGLLVNCWTVDDPCRAEQLCEWGIDFITSNILE